MANWVAAGLLAFTIFFYVVIYTIGLKRWTPQNIVIGGAAGAFPPMVGWAAVTGSVSWESAVLFAIIFLWTPPHFWALALYKEDEFARAGIPMMPNVKGAGHTRLEILLYTIVLVPVCLLPYVLGFAGAAYLVVASVNRRADAPPRLAGFPPARRGARHEGREAALRLLDSATPAAVRRHRGGWHCRRFGV